MMELMRKKLTDLIVKMDVNRPVQNHVQVLARAYVL
jgi:hypothetical protein